MLHLTLICCGKLKESYWREAENEYLKRLQPYAKLEIVELREESFGEKDNVAEVKKKEAAKIMAEIQKRPSATVVALDEHGKQFSSTALAEQLNTFLVQGDSNIVIVIGGPLGLDPAITKLTKLTLSLSILTFTHQMARIVLWEQLYRAQMILQGKKYHY